MIKYIGSKRRLVPAIVAIARELPGVTRACDLFTDTTRVAQGLKAAGLHVHANDLASYSEVLGRAFVETDARDVDVQRLCTQLATLSALPGRDGYVTRTFCHEARYFQPHNGRRIDAIRSGIDGIAGDEREHALLLAALLLAADRVDSTTGLQMAYLKQWAPRSFKQLELRLPELLAGPGLVTCRDANELAPHLYDVDLVYLDPPYNQHSYRSNYHVWETIVRDDAPDSYGVARKRVDCRDVKSEFNSRTRAWPAFERLVRDIDAPYLVVSFSDEGFLASEAIEQLLGERGAVLRLDFESARYVGARIGIHNPQGERVGTVSHVRNREHLFVAGPEESVLHAAVERALPALTSGPAAPSRPTRGRASRARPASA